MDEAPLGLTPQILHSRVSGNLKVAVLFCMSDGPPSRDQVAEHNSEALFCDGYDHALVGVAERFGMNPVAAYDYDTIIQTLMDGGCSHEEAVEFFDFNIIGAWLGDNTPVFVRVLSAEKPPDQSQKPSS